MTLNLEDQKTKTLMVEALVELLQDKRQVFYEVVLEALEEVGLANAIIEGEETDLVDESEIRRLLRGLS
jgi:hypothetical protein